MIDWFFSGLISLLSWLWHSAMTLYYLAGFFIVVGGLIMFAGSVIHHLWKRSTEHQLRSAAAAQPRVTIYVENMTLEVTEPQLRRLLEDRDLKALPFGDQETE